MKKLFTFVFYYFQSSAQYSAPIEFIHSTYGLGYGSKIYPVDDGTPGNTSLRIAIRGNSTTFTDAFYIRAGDGGYNANVGIGSLNPTAKLTVMSPIQLSTVVKSSNLLTSVQGLVSNNVQSNTWLVRNSAGSDWLSTRVHEGISIDGSFLSPQTDTKTWWERDPYNDVQS